MRLAKVLLPLPVMCARQPRGAAAGQSCTDDDFEGLEKVRAMLPQRSPQTRQRFQRRGSASMRSVTVR